MKTITIDEYIKILGLNENFLKLSKEDEQKQALAVAWKKFVLKNHPDVNKNSNAEKLFKEGYEAREKILEYIENRSFQGQNENNSNSNDDEFDEAIKEFFREFDVQQKRKEEAQREKEKKIIIKILGILAIIAIVAISILGLPLTLLIVANFLVGKLKFS